MKYLPKGYNSFQRFALIHELNPLSNDIRACRKFESAVDALKLIFEKRLHKLVSIKLKLEDLTLKLFSTKNERNTP